MKNRGVARGRTSWARAPLNLADQFTLFKPGRADYVPHTTASPFRFKKLSTPLKKETLKQSKAFANRACYSCLSNLFFFKSVRLRF
jgi:hypothetical protein